MPPRSADSYRERFPIDGSDPLGSRPFESFPSLTYDHVAADHVAPPIRNYERCGSANSSNCSLVSKTRDIGAQEIATSTRGPKCKTPG